VLLRIRKVPGSNIGPDWDLSWLSSVPPSEYRDTTLNYATTDYFKSLPIHHSISPFHSTVYNLIYWKSVVKQTTNTIIILSEKKCYIPRTNWASWTTCFISLSAFSSHSLYWRNLNIDSPLRKKSCYRPLRWSLGCRSPQVGVAVTRVADHDVMIPCSLSSVSVMPHIWLNPFLVFNPSPCHTLAPFTSTAPLFLYFSSTVLCIWVGGGMKENACAVCYWPAVLILPM
jgi:hypothetical protein